MIVGFYGRKGAGKTQFMTALGEHAYRHGIKVYSNYPVTFPVIRTELTDWLKMLDEGGEELKNSMLLWDEAYCDADARRSQSSFNINTGYLGFQNRKLRCDLLYSFIKYTTLENRLREASDMVVVCEAVPPFGRPELFIYRFCVPPSIILHGLAGLDEYEVVRTIITRAEDWKPVWKMYDTYWKITPKQVEERRAKYLEERKQRSRGPVRKEAEKHGIILA
jgi:hypothetical protein